MLLYILERIKDVLSSKIILDNKKNKKKSLQSMIPTCGGEFTSWLHVKIFFLIKNVADYKLFVYASTQSNIDQGTYLWLVLL